ncbi:MAG: hypothetical protein ACI8Z1_002687 [Candidatus Azotimanducaceae bacterium]|jgi:hypothetical protein
MRYCHSEYTSRANFIFCLIFNNLTCNLEQLAGTDLLKNASNRGGIAPTSGKTGGTKNGRQKFSEK